MTSEAARVSATRAATLGSANTSLSACLYAEDAWHRTHFGLETRRSLRSRRLASTMEYSKKASLVKPGPASTMQRRSWKSTWRVIASRICLNQWSRDFFPLCTTRGSPCFGNAFASSRARTIDMPPEMMHTFASPPAAPSLISTAAISAPASSFAMASLSRSSATLSQSSLCSEKGRCSSSVSVWCDPKRTPSTSFETVPPRRSSPPSGSKSILRTCTVRFILTRWLSTEPVDDSLETLRIATEVIASPRTSRL
mmetsp:Transcript_32405/g.85008  ORF Transcript_32405/g.85008 Transcript_32405/m.85008 type:complete len:254 (+) Transcript_32405:1000-1761(+)